MDERIKMQILSMLLGLTFVGFMSYIVWSLEKIMLYKVMVKDLLFKNARLFEQNNALKQNELNNVINVIII